MTLFSMEFVASGGNIYIVQIVHWEQDFCGFVLLDLLSVVFSSFTIWLIRQIEKKESFLSSHLTHIFLYTKSVGSPRT